MTSLLSVEPKTEHTHQTAIIICCPQLLDNLSQYLNFYSVQALNVQSLYIFQSSDLIGESEVISTLQSLVECMLAFDRLNRFNFGKLDALAIGIEKIYYPPGPLL